MPRVIQDSEDDGELDGEPVVATVLDARILPDGSHNGSSDAAAHMGLMVEGETSMHGTSSTEKLQRDIQQAQSALFDPTQLSAARRRILDDMDRNTIADSASPVLKKLKRTKTTGSSTTTTPREKSKLARSKTLTMDWKKAGGMSLRSSQEMEPSGKHVDMWDLPSSARTPSTDMPMTFESTENDGTLTQGEIVATEAFSIEGGHIVRTDSPDPLVDNSALNGTVEEPTLLRPIADTPSQAMGDDFVSHNPAVLFPENSSIAIDSTSLSSGKAVLEDSPALACRDETMKHVITEEDSSTTKGGISSSHEPFNAVREEPEIHQIVEANDPTNTGKEQGFLNKHRIVVVSVPRRRSRTEQPPSNDQSQNRKKAKLEFEPSEGSKYDELVGPQEEMYKPRPSRSRGFEAMSVEPVDLIVDPIKISRKKLRRSKTTGTVSAYSTLLREMGFRSSQVERALEEHGGDADAALETLLTRKDNTFSSQRSPLKPIREDQEKEVAADGAAIDEEDELVDATPQPIVTTTQAKKSARGRPKKAKEVVIEEEIFSEVDEVVKEDEGPKKSERGRPKKAEKNVIEGDKFDEENGVVEEEEEAKESRWERPKKAKELVIEREESDEADEAFEEEEVAFKLAPMKLGPKKKGRGRPKSAQKISDDVVVDFDDTETSEPSFKASTSVTNPYQSRRSLQDLDTNPRTKTGTEEHETQQDGDHDVELLMSVNEKDTSQIKKAVVTEREQEISNCTTPATITKGKLHSPIKTANVPFKVGLSKRARIEPLLRIMRK